jgi:hypothetical protein
VTDTANSLLDAPTGVTAGVAHAPARIFVSALPPDKGQIRVTARFREEAAKYLVFAIKGAYDPRHADRDTPFGEMTGRAGRRSAAGDR